MRPVLALLLLTLLATGCQDDHGPAVPPWARDALDCAGTPWQTGRGDYDSGLESVQDDPAGALEDWQAEEGWFVPAPQVRWTETARRDGSALLTWSAQGFVVGAAVLRDGLEDVEGGEGWGVASYAFCDPAEWPPAASDEVHIGVWSNGDGDRVSTSIISSFHGAEHCGWQDVTFLRMGEEGADGRFVARPTEELTSLLEGEYAEHVAVPADAVATAFQREGRRLWLAADGSAAYVGTSGTDAERWPAERRPIGCD